MMYVLAVILPPIALFAVGKPVQGIINLIIFGGAVLLWLLSLGLAIFITFPLWIICVIHSVIATHNALTEQKMHRIASSHAAGGGRQD